MTTKTKYRIAQTACVAEFILAVIALATAYPTALQMEHSHGHGTKHQAMFIMGLTVVSLLFMLSSYIIGCFCATPLAEALDKELVQEREAVLQAEQAKEQERSATLARAEEIRAAAENDERLYRIRQAFLREERLNAILLLHLSLKPEDRFQA